MRLWAFCNRHNIVRVNDIVQLSTGPMHCIRRVNGNYVGICCLSAGLKKLMSPISLDSGNKHLMESDIPSELANDLADGFYSVFNGGVGIEYIDISTIPTAMLRAEYSIDYMGVFSKSVFWSVTPVTVPNSLGVIYKPVIVSGYGRVGVPGLIMSPEGVQSDCGARRVDINWTIKESLDCVNATLNFDILRMAADHDVAVSSFGTVKMADILPKYDEVEEEVLN